MIEQQPEHDSGSFSLFTQDNKKNMAEQIYETEQDEKTVVEEEPDPHSSKLKSFQESDTATKSSISTQIEKQFKSKKNDCGLISYLSSTSAIQEEKSDHQKLEDERPFPRLIVPKHRLKVKRHGKKGKHTSGQEYQHVIEHPQSSLASNHKPSSASNNKSKDQNQSLGNQQAKHSKWKLTLFNPPTPPSTATTTTHKEETVSRKRRYSESEVESDSRSYSSSSSNSTNSSRSTSSKQKDVEDQDMVDHILKRTNLEKEKGGD
ncbi:unnamed protein product [Ambrosiozyma monospora]|uniref:Unnamed protein product n=1 Tax=Ambrosiozyma monospora TaxID=43982 RepID=A0A9W6YYK4_AMBMO|nr:unnamed protein product [Ambrosiozyma monospora]